MEEEIIKFLLAKGGLITTVFSAILWGGVVIKKYVINGQINKFYRLKMRELAIAKAILRHLKDADRRGKAREENEVKPHSIG
jgi:hypothetical protein